MYDDNVLPASLFGNLAFGRSDGQMQLVQEGRHLPRHAELHSHIRERRKTLRNIALLAYSVSWPVCNARHCSRRTRLETHSAAPSTYTFSVRSTAFAPNGKKSTSINSWLDRISYLFTFHRPGDAASLAEPPDVTDASRGRSFLAAEMRTCPFLASGASTRSQFCFPGSFVPYARYLYRSGHQSDRRHLRRSGGQRHPPAHE